MQGRLPPSKWHFASFRELLQLVWQITMFSMKCSTRPCLKPRWLTLRGLKPRLRDAGSLGWTRANAFRLSMGCQLVSNRHSSWKADRHMQASSPSSTPFLRTKAALYKLLRIWALSPLSEQMFLKHVKRSKLITTYSATARTHGTPLDQLEAVLEAKEESWLLFALLSVWDRTSVVAWECLQSSTASAL